MVRNQRGFGRTSRRSIMLGVSLLCLGAAGAVAQEGGSTDVPANTARPIRLEPIIVAGAAPPATGVIGAPSLAFSGGQVATQARLGAFGNRDVLRTPFRLTGYTEKTIRDQQARSVADVTLNEPSVRQDAPAFSERDSFFIRGFSVTNLDTLYDGLPYIGNPRKGHLEGIEQVDVLLGPTALALGGTGRVGGTINLIPKRAGDEPLTRLTTSWLSDSQIWTHLDVGRRYGASGEWGVRGNLSYRNGDTALEHNSNEIGVATLGLDYRSDRLRASFDLNHTNQNINAPTSLFNAAPELGREVPFTLPDAPDGDINTSNPFEFHDSSYNMAAGRVEYDIQPNTTVYAAAGISRYRENFLTTNYEIFNSNGDALNYYGYNPQEIEGNSVEVGLRSAFTTGAVEHQLNIGLTYSMNENHRGLDVHPSVQGFEGYPINIYDPVYQNGPPDISGLPRAKDTIPFSDLRTRSIFIADTMSFMDNRVQLTLGGRYTDFHTRGFVTRTRLGAIGSQNFNDEQSDFSPAIAASARVTEDLTVYANYVEALTEGPTAPNAAANAGQLFPASVNKQKEIGARYELGGAVLSAALFEIRQPNGFTDLVTGEFGVNGHQVNRGLELAVFGEPIDGLRLLGGVTFMDAELDQPGGETDGNDAPGIPDTAVSLYAEYDTPWIEDLSLNGRVVYSGSNYYDPENTVKVADWTRLDLGARYTMERPNGRSVEFRANINNVLNENYWASSARGFLAAGAPRTFALSASMTF